MCKYIELKQMKQTWARNERKLAKERKHFFFQEN